jgi:hypothetical protein
MTAEDKDLLDRKPPFEGWFVVEVDVARDRDNPLFASIRGPFPTREKAEHERDEQEAAWERALEEWDDGNPYDFKGWDIVKKNITDHQLRKLERQDEESYQIMRDAANAVGASLLAKEGIGPMAEDPDDD